MDIWRTQKSIFLDIIAFTRGMGLVISFEIKEESGMMKVRSTGTCENLEQLKEYVLAMHEFASTNDLPKALVDEAELEFKLSTIQTHESGRFVANLASFDVKIAVAIRKEDWDEAKFWETVVVNRGLKVKIFTDIEKAEEWLG